MFCIRKSIAIVSRFPLGPPPCHLVDHDLFRRISDVYYSVVSAVLMVESLMSPRYMFYLPKLEEDPRTYIEVYTSLRLEASMNQQIHYTPPPKFDITFDVRLS